jgi:hypothetical protein
MRVIPFGAAILLFAFVMPNGAAADPVDIELPWESSNPCFGATNVYEAAPVLVDTISNPGCIMVFTGVADGTTSHDGLPLFLGDWRAVG